MAREKAQRARSEGGALVDQLLGEPGTIGKLGGGRKAPLSNLISANRLARKVQEAATGISAEFPLPKFESVPFPKWLERHRPARGAGSPGEVELFTTCTGDYN